MAFPVQIDTAQLTYGHFRIPGVTGEQAVDGKTVPTLQFEPGSYSLFLDAAGQSVVFSVTPQGAIDYDQKYDRCLAGKGTAKLAVVGFDVTLDARPLKNSGVFFVGLPQESRERFTHKTPRLPPGTYRLQQRGGVVAAFQFTIEPDGTFRYDPSYDAGNGGFLSGAGTATLQLLGYPIQIDATQLSYPRFLLQGITPTALDGKAVQTLQLLPDVYNFQHGDFSFNVTPQGRLDFDPALDSFLSGRGGTTLTMSGFPVTLDGQRFPRGILLIAIGAFIKRDTVRLLPGTYFVQQTGGAVADFTFTVARDGTFAYDPAFDTGSGGFLSGRGTPTLEFVGHPILLDARDYQGVSLLVHGVTVANSTPELHPLLLLPHAEVALTLRTDPPTEAKFALGRDGTVTLKEAYPFLELQQQGGQTVVKLKKPGQLFTVSGRVQHADLRPFANGTVRALDITAGQGLTLAEATTNAEGRYAMSYSSEQLRPVQKANADLQIVALGGDGQELARSGVLPKAPPEATVDLTIGAPAGPAAFIVRGAIRQENGAPVAGVTVRAFDRDLPSLRPNEELLGEATTDAAGLYQITYTPDQLLHAETNSADLEVRVFNPEGAVLAASPIYFNAPPEATIDVAVTLPEQQPSELEQLLAQLEPVLAGVKPAALTGEDLAFLAGDTGIEQERLDLLRTADRHAQETGLPAAVFYGFGRQNLPLDLPELLDLDPAALRQALEATVAAKIIPGAVRESLDQIMARLDQLRGEGLAPVARQVTLRLLNQATSLPLVGYTVQFHDLDADPNPADLTPSTTSAQGLVMVGYTAMRRRGEADQAVEGPPRRLRLTVLTPEGQPVHQGEVAVSPAQQGPVDVPIPLPAPPEPPTHALSELSKALQHDLPAGLLDALAAQGVRTLGDVRRAGGLRQVQGLPVPPTDPSVRWLESHADLTMLSPDVQINEQLIGRGYPTVASIAEAARAEFVNTMRETLGDAQATHMHAVAQAQIGYLDNLVTAARVDQANGYQAPAAATGPRASGLPGATAATDLRCTDCLSAVSPLAYLADLLNYAVNHLRYQNKRIDLDWLTTTFHQPFTQLPAACDAVTSQVRQVRLSVEVLRDLLQSSPLDEGQTKAPITAEREYVLAAYSSLLDQIGTSFEELRATRAAPNGHAAEPQRRQLLAERLGVSPDKLDALLLCGTVITTFTTVTPVPVASLANDLEALFSLLQVPKDIDLGGSPQPEMAVGQLIEDALEALFGLDSTHTRHLSGERPAPKLQQWRQDYLRALWFEQDHPSDPYLEEPPGDEPAADLLPAIDPDVIGPDDLRLALDAEDRPLPDGNPAFAVWRERRLQVDRRLTELRNSGESAGQAGQDPFAALWQATYNSAIPDVGVLLAALTAGAPADRQQAETQLRAFDLSVEGFTRFATLRLRDQLARRQPAQAEPLTAEEWADVHSILTRVWKARQFPAWRKQEHEASVALGGELFWPSLTEPLEGAWPPALPAQQPLIDPERVKLSELPDPTVGGNARHLWQVRQAQLQQIRQALREAYRSGGFDALLAHAFGAVPDLAKLQNDLKSADPQVVEGAKAVITAELHLTVEGFLRLMTAKIKPVPSAAELGEVYGLLVTAHKGKGLYGAWLAEEQQRGLTAENYWGAWKARLPRWRAGVEERQRWRQALSTRLQPPLIDPDLGDGGYFAKPKAQNPAYQLRRTRRAWVEARLRNLRDSRRQAGKALLAWFDGALADAIGAPASVLLSLADEQACGHPIAARLGQLTLPVQALDAAAAEGGPRRGWGAPGCGVGGRRCHPGAGGEATPVRPLAR